MKVKVDIISGFLGAGKTTLIKKLLEEKLKDEKAVIIENEFGEVGIDGNILKNSGIEIKEINSGCICCTLAGDFEKAVEEAVAKYKPDRIIIEPSGVGKLSDVLKVFDAPALKEKFTVNMVITVVDIQKYQIYTANFGEFFENQIKNAKTIILSRTQKADSKKLEASVDNIHKLNPHANIITTPWVSLNAGLIIAAAEHGSLLSLEEQIKAVKSAGLRGHNHAEGCECGCKDNHSHNNNTSEFFEVWSAETPKTYDENDLKGILKTLGNEKSYGKILRGKGILQLNKNRWVQFDYIPGELEIKNTKADYTGRLCIIGKDLNKNGLNNLFSVTA